MLVLVGSGLEGLLVGSLVLVLGVVIGARRRGVGFVGAAVVIVATAEISALL